jgi:N2-citryl-N6-acetyl-N6-hydroxylysine synthase
MRYRSLVGRHRFEFPASLSMSDDGNGTAIDLAAAAALVVDEPSLVGVIPPAKQWQFLQRLCNSLMTFSEVFSARAGDWTTIYDEPLDFLRGEQALLLGHPTHPTAKCRDEFSTADLRRYSPEFGNAFGLAWFLVDPQLLHEEAASSIDPIECTRQLLKADPTLPEDTAGRLVENGRWALLPAHPWQAGVLLNHPIVRDYEQSGRLRYVGELGAAWHGTSSLRSVYAAHSPWMLKCSLNVRLTNAMRTLTADEPARGRDIQRMMTSSVGRQLKAAYPAFQFLAEPAHVSLKAPTGRPLHDASVLFRSNPFQGDSAREVMMMATLCQDDLLQGGSRLSRLIASLASKTGEPSGHVAEAWFDRFLAVAVEPLLVARGNYGLVFGAHQQNMLLRLVNGWPVGSYYRDCFGTFFISEMKARLCGLVVDQSGFVPRSVGDRLLAHNLVSNNVLNVVATLAHSGMVAESALVAVLRHRLHELRQIPLADRSFVEHLLDGPTIETKANLLTILQDVDESRPARGISSEGPSYVELPNPIQR